MTIVTVVPSAKNYKKSHSNQNLVHVSLSRTKYQNFFFSQTETKMKIKKDKK